MPVVRRGQKDLRIWRKAERPDRHGVSFETKKNASVLSRLRKKIKRLNTVLLTFERTENFSMRHVEYVYYTVDCTAGDIFTIRTLERIEKLEKKRLF